MGKGQLAIRLNPPQTPMPAWDHRDPGTAPWAPSFIGTQFMPGRPLGERIRSKEEGRDRGVASNCNGVEYYQQKPWEGTPQLLNT